jgi:hypothetical protein
LHQVFRQIAQCLQPVVPVNRVAVVEVRQAQRRDRLPDDLIVAQRRTDRAVRMRDDRCAPRRKAPVPVPAAEEPLR